MLAAQMHTDWHSSFAPDSTNIAGLKDALARIGVTIRDQPIGSGNHIYHLENVGAKPVQSIEPAEAKVKSKSKTAR